MSVAKVAANAAGATGAVLGIDLRSGPRYRTGVAALDAGRRVLLVRPVRTDEEIADAIAAVRPSLVAIDAPLALPEGRCCADPACACARFGILRAVDRAVLAAGYRVFPALLPSMVGLTLRGAALHARLAAAGIPAVEVFPGMAQDRLGLPRKQADLAGLERGLRRLGVRGLPRARRLSHDELDAVTCALVALLHRAGATESFGPGVPVAFVAPRADVAGALSDRRARAV
jgi:predicted nuclease with RNAse H fold